MKSNVFHPKICLIICLQLTGVLDKVNVRRRLPLRSVNLEDIVPSEDVLAHVFLGFTQNGQYLLSYNIENNVLTLFIWVFRLNQKLVLNSSHVVFEFNEGVSSMSFLARDHYDSTALSIYQWPEDDNHLLIFVVPDHPVPSVANVSVIYFDCKSSRILSPGIIPYAVVGWSQRYKFFETRDKLGLEDVLTPGLVFCPKNKCSFHTGSEVVSLSIQTNESSLESQLVSKSLDIEALFGDLIEGGTEENYVRLITYELFVFGIRDSKTLEVDSFIHAVVGEKNSYHCNSFREFTLTWDVDKESYEVHHDRDQDKENETEEESKVPEKPLVPVVFEHMVQTHTRQKIYCLDNMQFVECQLSLDSIRCPTDSVVIELSQTGPDSMP